MKLKIKARKKSLSKPFYYFDTCEHCTHPIAFTLDDVKYGEYGCAYIECPHCGERTFVLNGDLDLSLTKDNFKYPQHFADFSDAVRVPDEDIEIMCKECVAEASDPKNKSHYAVQAAGDTLIFAVDGAYETYVYVCHNYKELIIDKEEN